ncbi:MAG: glycosyltransferase family 4 protein [Bacteroidaceae bacterium]|nr:glycosyltransferase family 4 protein [Bacteroidaceae bacterium]
MKIIRTATIGMSLDIFCRGLLRELSEEGHDIVALSSPDSDLHSLGEREGVRTIGVEMARQISPWSDLRSLWKLWRVFRRERPDMVHSMTPKAGLLSMIAARLAGVPLRVHTFTGLVWPTERGLKRLILQTTDRLTCLCATHIIPEGQGVMHDLQREITHKPMRVLGYGNVRGVDMEYYQPRNIEQPGNADSIDNLEHLENLAPLNHPVFLFVGRILPDKGVRELVEAFLRLRRGTLLLVGPTEQALPLPENERIIQVGMQADVRPWMEMADVLVLPSYREGFPNVVLEAGAMELPCIVTDINGSREIVVEGETGLIVPARSADHLLQAMQWMADHPEERRAMGRKARPHIAKHWEQSYVRQCLKDYYVDLCTLQPHVT